MNVSTPMPQTQNQPQDRAQLREPAAPASLHVVLRGARESLSVGLAAGVYGAAYGILARQAGLAPLDCMAMSGLVFAGASQFVALEFWNNGALPVLSIVFATLVVNLRHLLMGAAIAHWLAELPAWRRAVLMFVMTDESWALTIAAKVPARDKAAYLLGSGVCFYLCWNLATMAGALLVPEMADPARYGLDFVFIAAFLALLAGMYRCPADVPPWIVAALAALLASRVLPGKWYIIVGGIAGGLVGMLDSKRSPA